MGGGGGGSKFAPQAVLCYSSTTVGARLQNFVTFIVSLLHIIWYTFWLPGT